jgi:TonB family protein
MRNRITLYFFIVVSVFALVPTRALSQQSAEIVRKVVSQVVPQYPSLARSMNIQGVVRADVTVAPNGKVKSIDLKGGHPLLGQAAQDALRQWKWEPAARESIESVELRFHP